MLVYLVKFIFTFHMVSDNSQQVSDINIEIFYIMV